MLILQPRADISTIPLPQKLSPVDKLKNIL